MQKDTATAILDLIEALRGDIDDLIAWRDRVIADHPEIVELRPHIDNVRVPRRLGASLDHSTKR